MATVTGKRIGEALLAARKAKGMTQARLAKKAGVVRETVYRLEAGRLPTACVLNRICFVLDVDIESFDFKRKETDAYAQHPPLTLLRDRRRSLGLTLEQCAARAGVSPATLSRFERGSECSRALAAFDASGRAVRLINEDFAAALGFASCDELDLYWRTGRLRQDPAESR
ncbi:helix-turn-helix transcriptional regulator [Sphingomonas corticis]|nr:helix-turn-helix transcriptional regulator [Sphingomonas corticis]